MKDINKIKKECIGDVFTLDEFVECVEDGFFNSYDGDMMEIMKLI